jgi:hypothetical protein
MTPSAPRETRVSQVVYKSLGLSVLLDGMRGDRSYSILDLGPALEGNVRFWSQFSCWLHVYNFYRSYRERKAAAGPKEVSGEAGFSALLPFSDETVFDIILAWDLFDYFDLRELEALVQRLSRWCRPGTRLFALISSLPNIPASPTVFRIRDREQMIYEVPTQATRPCPRHQPRDILRLMAQFNVRNSFLLRHGTREYVFEFK